MTATSISVSYPEATHLQGPSRTDIPGLSLRELVYEFRHQTLVLFKCVLLQPKVASQRSHGWRIYPRLISIDAILWLAMRTAMHDAVLTSFACAGTTAEFRRLQRSRPQHLRIEIEKANFCQN